MVRDLEEIQAVTAPLGLRQRLERRLEDLECGSRRPSDHCSPSSSATKAIDVPVGIVCSR